VIVICAPCEIGMSLLDECSVTDLAAGTAAEHIVCADLLLRGLCAYRTEQVCAYDIAIDIGGRLLRVQVKSTRAPRAIPQRVGHRPAYLWHVRRAGKAGARNYDADEFDMLALVALDSRRIAYLPPSASKQTVHIRTHDDPAPSKFSPKGGKTFDQFPLDAALREVLHG
jgi:hypothetical protein